jgi:hypothetical protein
MGFGWWSCDANSLCYYGNFWQTSNIVGSTYHYDSYGFLLAGDNGNAFEGGALPPVNHGNSPYTLFSTVIQNTPQNPYQGSTDEWGAECGSWYCAFVGNEGYSASLLWAEVGVPPTSGYCVQQAYPVAGYC